LFVSLIHGLMKRLLLTTSFLVLTGYATLADGPKDNLAENVRRIPKDGVSVPAADRSMLQEGIAVLGAKIERLRKDLEGKPELLELLPDVEIYHRAAWSALTYNEFFKANEIQTAKGLLQDGISRAGQLENGQAPWLTKKGLVVRGYRSKIDHSVQPYGLVVPETWTPGAAVKHRLDFWFHGRGETLSEVNFINGRQRSAGQYAPADTFVLHPYGRYSNANKFAGEVDLFEALAHAKKHYPIDDDRIAVRGFSMGGAACWQFAVHYPDLWFAANPGAGFSETPEFLRTFQGETLTPTWYEKKLWHLYDCTDWAANLFHCPTVAYSGEVDRQKQAADIMEKYLAEEGIDMTHIIGPGTAHRIHKDSAVEVERRMTSLAKRGRDIVPNKLRFTTWTLRYNRMLWVTVDGMEEHWERARVEAEIGRNNFLSVTTKNVSELTLDMPSGHCPMDMTQPVNLVIDGQHVAHTPRVQSDRSWKTRLSKSEKGWEVAVSQDAQTLRKRHGLQGPIDDAFMDSFIIVRPTGKAWYPKVAKWAESEQAHAIEHWRRHFRGEARVKDDVEITDADIASSNLILFGDPSSNRVLTKILDSLPIRWTAGGVVVGDKKYDGKTHAPIMIYPNPLNPDRYIVLNSGFTFREYDYLNNARQVPKLPDWAVADISQPVTSRAPGKIVDAGFFGERWELKARPK
jgi:dienelactone hydrolase